VLSWSGIGRTARTFFGYFAGKEDILFPDSDARTRATITAIADRDPAESPSTCCCGHSTPSPSAPPTW
jgi:hypothetical protein